MEEQEKYGIVQVNKNAKIVQSNYLIENKPKMSYDAFRMFLTLISAINSDKAFIQDIKIKVTDIIGLWNIDSKGAYRRVKKSLEELMTTKFELEFVRADNTKYVEATTYISSFRYGEGDGYAIVKVDPTFAPHLLDLKEKFTLYGVNYGYCLGSYPRARTYELLAQYMTIGKRSMTVSDYKKKVGLENKYKGSNANLRKNVLDKACTEITEKTNLIVKYDIEGRGENAIIQFVILKKDLPEFVPRFSGKKSFAEEEKEVLLDLLITELRMDRYFSENKLKLFIEMATVDLEDSDKVLGRYDVLQDSYAAFQDQILKKENGEIKNKVAYFKKILISKLEMVEKSPL